jgi:hypothetical protein
MSASSAAGRFPVAGIWPELPGLPPPEATCMLRKSVFCPPQIANMRFSIHTKKACLRRIFTSRPENRDRVSNCNLESYGLVIHAARSGFILLGHLRYQCFRGKHKSGDRGGVLQRVPGHFRRVDHACFY